MAWPAPTDYAEAIQRPSASLEDEELRGGKVVRTPLGLPMLWSGNFADVFKIDCPATGNTWALKCFTREVSGQCDRYRRIAAHLEQARLPFTVDFQYLEQGIRIHGQRYPVLKMRWVEGLTLAEFVEEHLDRPANLKMLLDMWVKLSSRLYEAGIAHADLQHGNVVLVPMEGSSLALRLIDYDGMYVPSLAGTRSSELGHPAYQHPQRCREGTYNAEVDRFSHLVIYCGIRCLMLGRQELWQQFNNGDNLLFREADFLSPRESELFHVLWKNLLDPDSRALFARVVLACETRLEEVPRLEEVVADGKVLPLSAEQEAAVDALLAPPAKLPARPAAADDVPLDWLMPPESKMPAEARVETLDSTSSHLTLTGAELRALIDPPPAPGKSLLGRLGEAARGLGSLIRRLVGTENAIRRYALWAAVPLLLLAVALATSRLWMPSAATWKLCSIEPQIIETGKPLRLTASVENAAGWQGKLRYGLGPQCPADATIDAETGELAWTPSDQAAGNYDFTVFVESPNGRHRKTSFTVTVIRRLEFKPIPAQTVEIEKPLTIPITAADADSWNGTLRFRLDSAATIGATVDPQTGLFAWTPGKDQKPGKYEIAIVADGPDGQKGKIAIEIAVIRPLRFRFDPQTAEVGKSIAAAALVDDADYWQGKLRFSLGPAAPAEARIDPQTGLFTWTPDKSQEPGKREVVVMLNAPDGQKAQTALTIFVVRPLRLGTIDTQTIETGS